MKFLISVSAGLVPVGNEHGLKNGGSNQLLTL